MQPASFWAHHAHVYVPRPKADHVELSTHEDGGDGGDAVGDAGGGIAGIGGAPLPASPLPESLGDGGGDAGHVPHVTGQAVVWPYVLL